MLGEKGIHGIRVVAGGLARRELGIIAIADNDPGALTSLAKMLGNLGHEVVAVAENGESLVN